MSNYYTGRIKLPNEILGISPELGKTVTTFNDELNRCFYPTSVYNIATTLSQNEIILQKLLGDSTEYNYEIFTKQKVHLITQIIPAYLYLHESWVDNIKPYEPLTNEDLVSDNTDTEGTIGF